MNEKTTNKTRFKRRWTIILLWVMVMLTSFSLVSALDFGIDNFKEFKPNDNYGKISIWDRGQLGADTKLAEHVLDYNTDICYENCEARGTSTLYQDGRLFSDLDFKNRAGKGVNLREYHIYIWTTETYEITVYETEETCKDNFIASCTSSPTGKNHIEKKTREYWKEYDGGYVDAGTYKWKITGKKDSGVDIDWIAESFGRDLSEWAWWSGSYSYCKNIDFQTDATPRINEPVDVNFTISDTSSALIWVMFNGTDDTNYSAYYNDLTDFRIVNGSCGKSGVVELDFELISNSSEASAGSSLFEWYDIGAGETNGTAVTTNNWTLLEGTAGQQYYSMYRNIRENTSIFMDGTVGGDTYQTINKSRPNTAGTISYYFYDNGDTDAETRIISVIRGSGTGTGDYRFWFGVHVTTSSTEYTTRRTGEGDYEATGIGRDTGWHVVKYVINESRTHLFFDGSYVNNYSMINSTAGGVHSLIFYAYDTATWYDSVIMTDSMDFNQYVSKTNYTIGEEQESEGAELEVTLNDPAASFNTSVSPIWFNATFVAVNANLTNATLYIWNSDSTVYGVNTTTYINGTNNATNLSFSDILIGDGYLWNYYACSLNSTESLCNFAPANRTFNFTMVLGGEYYEASVAETATTTFQLNVTAPTGHIPLSGLLVYNGTGYLGTKTGTGTFTRDLDIPISGGAKQTKNFVWQIAFTKGAITAYVNATRHIQEISTVTLHACDVVTYNTTILNFTMFNEITGDRINETANATDIEVTFNYWSGLGAASANYSYQNLSNYNDSQYKFCILPADKTVYSDMEMMYDAIGYSERTYYLVNATLDNITNEITLYLMPDSDAVQFFVDVKDGLAPFTEGTITISKYFTGEGVYKTIGIRETDDEGEFIEYLELDKKYQFSIARDGESYGTIIKQAVCAVAPCKITLQIETAATDYWQGYYDYFATDVAYSLTYNDSSKTVTYTFTDLTGLAQWFRLYVSGVAMNQTGAVICNDTLYSTSGTLTCDLTGQNGEFKATGYISRSPEKILKFIFITIRGWAEACGADGILITLFIIVTVALIGAWSPAIGVVLMAFAVLMSMFLGFMSFTYITVAVIFVFAIWVAMRMAK